MRKRVEEILLPTDMDGLDTANLVGIAGEHTDEVILKLLARHPNVLVRMAVAGNCNITTEVEVLLANDSRHIVLEILGENPSADFRLRVSEKLNGDD